MLKWVVVRDPRQMVESASIQLPCGLPVGPHNLNNYYLCIIFGDSAQNILPLRLHLLVPAIQYFYFKLL